MVQALVCYFYFVSYFSLCPHMHRVSPVLRYLSPERYDNTFTPLMGIGIYNVTSNNMNLIHWPLMGGLFLAVPNVTAHPPINGQCTKHRIAV